MRHFLLLAIAALLSGVFFTPGNEDLFRRPTGDPAPARVGFHAPVTTELFAPGTSDVVAASGTANVTWPTCFGQVPTLVGTDRDDQLVGTPGPDVIVARAGDDVVRGRGGDDIVCAGAGADRIRGGDHRDRLSGGAGSDRIVGGAGRDLSMGDKGPDRLVDGGFGNYDLLLGGPGDDWLRSLPTGYAEFRTLKGGPGEDRLINGGSTEGRLVGGGGPDRLTSRGHNDLLIGGTGSDVLTLEGSGDTLLALTADGDRVRIHGAAYVVLLKSDGGPLEVDLAAGTVRLVGATTGDVLTNVSQPLVRPAIVAYGTDGDDQMSGPVSGDWTLLFGLAGNDTMTLHGRGSLVGGRGNDMLTGGGGDDSLSGGRGDDYLDGGGGDDSASGGRGSDTCVNSEQVTGCSP